MHVLPSPKDVPNTTMELVGARIKIMREEQLVDPPNDFKFNCPRCRGSCLQTAYECFMRFVEGNPRWSF